MKTLLIITLFALLIGCKANKNIGITEGQPFDTVQFMPYHPLDSTTIIQGTDGFVLYNTVPIQKPVKYNEVDIFWTDSSIQIIPKQGKDGYASDIGAAFYFLYMKTVSLQKQVDSLKLFVK